MSEQEVPPPPTPWRPKAGDVVVLKSGSPPLAVVEGVDEDGDVVVAWLGTTLEMQYAALPAAALRTYVPPPPYSYRRPLHPQAPRHAAPQDTGASPSDHSG